MPPRGGPKFESLPGRHVIPHVVIDPRQKPATLRSWSSVKLPSLLTAFAWLALTLVGVAVSGCANSQYDAESTRYESTVAALLPAREATPTVPPTIAPTDTPPPTYTPRPAPTYTPRPLPAAPFAGEREDAPIFQAALLDGAVYDLADTLSTPTLLAFWAPW